MTTPNDEDRAIKRYTFDDEYCSANFTDSCEANMEEKADGAYVLYSDHVAALAAERAKAVKFEAALRMIAEHPHQSYEISSIEVADGHRCAANIARLALETAAAGKEK